MKKYLICEMWQSKNYEKYNSKDYSSYIHLTGCINNFSISFNVLKLSSYFYFLYFAGHAHIDTQTF